MIPTMHFKIEIPEQLVDSDRVHNKIVKEVLNEVLEEHWKKRIPGHFKRDAHRKYDYSNRLDSYIRMKQRKYRTGGLDLVMTGKTREAMTTQHQIRTGGTAVKGNISSTLILRFPFMAGYKKKRPTVRTPRRSKVTILTPGVTLAMMRREVAAFTSDELREVSTAVGRKYVEKLKGRRFRKKVVEI